MRGGEHTKLLCDRCKLRIGRFCERWKLHLNFSVYLQGVFEKLQPNVHYGLRNPSLLMCMESDIDLDMWDEVCQCIVLEAK